MSLGFFVLVVAISPVKDFGKSKSFSLERQLTPSMTVDLGRSVAAMISSPSLRKSLRDVEEDNLRLD